MSEPNVIASQPFFYIKRDNSEATYAFEMPDGITVPIFSSLALANNFLEKARIRSHVIGIIAPLQMEAFTKTCNQAGAKFLQLDPKPEILKNIKVKNLGGPA